MPIYHVGCGVCGAEDDVYRPVDRYDDLPACCGQKMSRLVTAPYVVTDIQPYRSMIDGTMITSRSQHREHLKAHNCIEVGNEISYLTRNSKSEIEISDESKRRRKELIIDQVNKLKG